MRSRRFPLAARRQKGDAPRSSIASLHAPEPGRLACLGITSGADRPRTPQVLSGPPPATPNSTPEPHERHNRQIRSNRQCSHDRDRADRVDRRPPRDGWKYRLRAEKTGSSRDSNGMRRRPAQAGTPTGCREDPLKPGLQREEDCTGSSRDCNMTKQGVHPVPEQGPPFLVE